MRGGRVLLVSLLDFAAVLYFPTSVRGQLWFFRRRVVQGNMEISNSCPLTDVGKSSTTAKSITLTRRTRPPLLTPLPQRVQKIMGALLWIGRAMNNKLLVALSAIGSQQASATESTNDAIHQLLYYCAIVWVRGTVVQAV